MRKPMQLMTTVADLMLLNLCWIVCSLPVVTAGAATAALHTVLGRRLRQEGSGVVAPFFRAFAADFKAATLYWLMQLPLTALLAFSLLFAVRNASLTPLLTVTKWSALLVLTCLGAVGSMLYPQLGRYENCFWTYLRNAAVLALRHPGRALLCAGLYAAPFLLAYFHPALFWRTAILWPLIGTALLHYLAASTVHSVFTALEAAQPVA